MAQQWAHSTPRGLAHFEGARIYSVFQTKRNRLQTDRLGVHTPDLFSDIDDHLRDDTPLAVPAFVFR